MIYIHALFSQIIFFGCLLLLISPFVQNVVFYQLYRKTMCYFFSSLEDNISLFSIICFVFVLYSVFNEHISAPELFIIQTMVETMGIEPTTS